MAHATAQPQQEPKKLSIYDPETGEYRPPKLEEYKRAIFDRLMELEKARKQNESMLATIEEKIAGLGNQMDHTIRQSE
jgi:CII-binding regulator of phage lambda lysogenization HflD